MEEWNANLEAAERVAMAEEDLLCGSQPSAEVGLAAGEHPDMPQVFRGESLGLPPCTGGVRRACASHLSNELLLEEPELRARELRDMAKLECLAQLSHAVALSRQISACRVELKVPTARGGGDKCTPRGPGRLQQLLSKLQLCFQQDLVCMCLLHAVRRCSWT